MYCEDCGKELKENEVCDCKKQGSAKGVNTEAGKEAPSDQRKKKLPVKAIGGVIAVIVVLIGVFVFLSTRPKKVQMGEFIIQNPKIVGLNGSASLSAEDVFDYDGFMEAVVSDKERKSEKKVEDLDEDMSDEELGAMFAESLAEIELNEEETDAIRENIVVSFVQNGKKVDTAQNISNGDTIEVKVSSKQPVNKHYNKKFVAGSYTYEISGLIDGTEVSAFDDKMLKVTFEGLDGEGRVETRIVSKHEVFNFVSIQVDGAQNGLSNGDKVVLKAQYDKQKLAEAGYCLKEDSKEYEVSGLTSLLKSAEGLTEKMLEGIRTVSLEKMNSSFKLVFIGAGSSGEVIYDGAYIVAAKPSVELKYDEEKNYLLIMGKYQGERSGETLYCFSRYPNVSLSEKGTILSNGKEISQAEVDNYRLSEEQIHEMLFESDRYETTKVE